MLFRSPRTDEEQGTFTEDTLLYAAPSLKSREATLAKAGEQYTVTIINNLEYASYVEYGHRQTPGRYVPALGKTLKASWVPGKLMLTISEQEVKALVPSILNDMLYDALKGVFS